MDATGVIMLLLAKMITLDLNSAESGDTEATVHDSMTVSSRGWPVHRRFEWRHLDGSPAANALRRSRSVETDDEDIDDPKSRAVYWIPTTCDPMVERGYTCLSCGESLHCMGGGFALKAVCFGRRPFCYNGVCSFQRSEKCNKEHDGPAVLAGDVSDEQASGNSTVLTEVQELPPSRVENNDSA